MIKFKYSIAVFFVVAVSFLCLTGSAFSQTCDVDDGGDDGSMAQLRFCADEVNMGNADIIEINTDVMLDGANGQINFNQDVDFTINGNDNTVTMVTDNIGNDRVFNFGGAFSNTIMVNDLTITGGDLTNVTSSGAGVSNSNNDLTLNCVTITGNDAGTRNGGGIRTRAPGATGSLTIIDSTISNNSARRGGGIRVNGHMATIMGTTISGNMAIDDMGNDSRGGAISVSNSASLMMTNSTISENSSEADGGGIWTNNPIELTHVTLANNTADSNNGTVGDGGGIFTRNSDDIVTTTNVLLFNNDLGDGTIQNCAGQQTFDADDNTFSRANSADCEDITNLAITGVNMLADNMGKTETNAVDPDSNVLRIANANCAADDQRGFGRSTPCTPGAFELQTVTVTITKDTLPDSGMGFDFTSDLDNALSCTGAADPTATLGNFTLDDGESVTCEVPAGTYNVTETPIVDNNVMITCSSEPMGGVTIDDANGTIDFTIVPEDGGGSVNCTYLNTDESQFILAVTVAGDAAASCNVTGPNGIDCGNNGVNVCAATQTPDSMATLTPNVILGVTQVWSGDCAGSADNGPATVLMDMNRSCTLTCSEMGGGDDDDDDDDNNDDNDDNNDDNNNDDNERNIVATNADFTLFGPSENGPFGDETTNQLVYTGQATGASGLITARNLNNLTIEILEDEKLEIVSAIIEPNIGSCVKVVQEESVSSKDVLSFVCTVPFLADDASFDLIMDVFIDERNPEAPDTTRFIEFIINSNEFSQDLIGFVTVLVADNGQGCTLAAAGTRELGTLAVFALIPGLVLLRIFRRRMSRNK